MNEVLQKFFLLVAVVAFLSHVSALMPAISLMAKSCKTRR